MACLDKFTTKELEEEIKSRQNCEKKAKAIQLLPKVMRAYDAILDLQLTDENEFYPDDNQYGQRTQLVSSRREFLTNLKDLKKKLKQEANW